MATPSVLAFDAEGRAIDFDVWVDDLQLFLHRGGPSRGGPYPRPRHLTPPPLFLVPGPPPVDPLPPQGPAPSGVSQVDAVEPVEVTGDSGAAGGAEPGGAATGGAEPGGAEPWGAEPGGAEPGGAEPGGAEPRGAELGGALPGGATPGCSEPWGAELRGAPPGVSQGTSSLREPLSPQELREWFARRWRHAAGAGGSSATEGAAVAGPGGARPVSPGAAGPAGSTGAGAAEGVGTETTAGGPSEGTPGAAGGSGAAGGAARAGAPAGGTGAVPAVSGVAARPRPYFVPLLEQVLGSPPSAGPPPSFACPQPVPSQLQLQPTSPLPAPSPYTGPTGGLAERREPASRPASPVRAARTSGRGSRQRPPPVPGTHRMSLRPSTAPLRTPLPSPPESSLPTLADPGSDSLRAASPTVTRLLATVVTDPSFDSTAASALVAELVDFAARCRLDYAASLVAESEPVCPPSVGGECALGTDVLEDRQEEFQCLAAASPHLVSVLLTPEGDPDALDIPTPRSYAEAIEARVRGQGHERYFLLVVDDYSRYTSVFPLPSKGDVTKVLIDWIRAARLQLRQSFGSDFPVLRLHSDRGGEFSSGLLGAYCRARGIRQTFTLPDSPQQNGIAERRIGMVMDVARTSMMHAAAPHFMWLFAVRYAAHQINLHPRVSRPETSPALLWTGKVGDASAFRVWGSRAFVRDLSADKLSPRATPCVFLGFPPDAPGWQFYHPTSRCVLSSQDVTFDESVPYYRLFPYRTPPPPPPPRSSLYQVPPPVDPLPPQGPAPSGVSQVDAVEPIEVTGDSGAAGGAEPGGAATGGAEPGGAELWGTVLGGAEPGGAASGGAEPGGAATGGAEPGGASPGCAAPRGAELRGAPPGGSPGASSLHEPLSPQELREWFPRRWRRAASAGGSSATEGAAVAGPGGARTVSTRAAGPASSTGAGAAEGVGTETTTGGPAGDPPCAAGGSGATGGAVGEGAPAGGTGAVPAVSGVAARPRPYFVPLLEQPTSPLPAPSPYTGPTGGLAERREPASRPASPVRAARTSGRGSHQRPPPVPCTHRMSLRPSTAPLRVPLPSPPESSFPALADPESDSLRAASPTVTRLLATVVTDPSFESTAASALVTELVDFAASCRLDYAASLVTESESVCPPSVGGECALGTDVLEDRQEEFQCLAAASPHLVSTLLAPEGDPDAPDIPTPQSYAEAIEGPYSSQWQAAMDAEMASWKSTGTYVDAVLPPGANIVSGMWIFRVKRPPGSPPVFKARYVARGFSQRQGVDYFQTFSPTPKMTTLRVLLHVAAHRDYELHSLDFSTAFLQGSLHEEIWLRRPLGFTGTFPPGTQWSLRWPVYGLRQAPHEWHDTLRTTLAALGFAPSTADPSLFLRTDTSLPPFYILVYVDGLVFATADTAGLAHVKSELQKRHTCTDLGELRSYLGLQITRDRAHRTITLTQSHMVQQVLQRFGFTYSSPQATPLPTRHSLSALPSDESVESCGPYPESVGCLMYLMTCTRPDLAYPLSILARYVAPGRHRPEHMAAAKRVLRYLCSTSGMGLVLGGRSPVVLTGHADASWADDQATQRSCEAEIYTGAMAAQELRWLTYLLTDLGEPPRSPPVLYVDNKAMLALCREQRLEHRTKRIALRYFLARELQQRGQLRLAYVASEANTADVFTKALAPCDHQRFCTQLGLLALLCFA
ncbi:unnamed protein product [Closterium sp. NIES-53]